MENGLLISYTPQEIRDFSSFIHNFDVSVIMPFYKKIEEFKKIFPINQPYLQRNGIEVIICMDEDSEESELIDYIKEYPFINWKVIVNHNKHDWRNPSRALNVGIRFATKEYVFVCSPESQFASDTIYLMRKALHYYPNHFAIGYVEFKSFDTNKTSYNFKAPYGSIMAKKEHLIGITGYDESLSKWGGDDDNIRARLEMIGIKKMTLPEVRLIHWEIEKDLQNRQTKHRAKDRPMDILREMLYPETPMVNGKTWGKDFDSIVYDWENKKYQKRDIEIFLQEFLNFDLYIEDLGQRFKKILLVQCYNEIELISDFLKQASKHFDAIILLDDEGTDGTYQKANHKKLILKVQKERKFFNDLENRNLLLKFSSFFNTDWIAFLDIDEIIDNRFCNFSFIKDKGIDVVAFHLVHLWNNEEKYNAEYPYAQEGIQLRYRMFKNIGYSQIITDKQALHFPLTPYVKNRYPAKILILHYGHMIESERIKKVSLYLNEDEAGDQHTYAHLLKNNPSMKKVEQIKYEDLEVNLY